MSSFNAKELMNNYQFKIPNCDLDDEGFLRVASGICDVCLNTSNLFIVDTLSGLRLDVQEVGESAVRKGQLRPPDLTSDHRILCYSHARCTSEAVMKIKTLRLEGRSLTCEEFHLMRLNSYDRDALIPWMDSSLLLENIELTLKNCSRISNPATTYEEALQLYVKEIVKRFRTLVTSHRRNQS